MTLVSLNRSLKPIYPRYVHSIIHPELELVGPSNYNLQTNVGQWFHENQWSDKVRGAAIYQQLKNDHFLPRCLSLQDGIAIKTIGIPAFSHVFGGAVSAFLWRSVGLYHEGHSPIVPFLGILGGELRLGWFWLSLLWFSKDPALYFK